MSFALWTRQARGIDKILTAMEDALLAPAEFEEREQSFVVPFRGRSVFAAEDRLWINRVLCACAPLAQFLVRLLVEPHCEQGELRPGDEQQSDEHDRRRRDLVAEEEP